MSHIGTTVGVAGPWSPAAPVSRDGVEPCVSMSLVLDATIGIARGEGDRIVASMRAAFAGPSQGDRLREPAMCIEAHGLSSGALADANPFVWFQLFDQRGTPVSHEAYLGRGVAVRRRVHSRIEVPVESAASEGGTHHVTHGLEAHIVVRTYRGETGPQYWLEVIVLPLLACHSEIPITGTEVQPVRVLSLVPPPRRLRSLHPDLLNATVLPAALSDA